MALSIETLGAVFDAELHSNYKCVVPLCVAAVSYVTHALFILITQICSRRVTKVRGFRGQWLYCMAGFNAGFCYPLLFAAPNLAPGVFAAVVNWDLAGNGPVVFGHNHAAAMIHAPSESAAGEPGLVKVCDAGDVVCQEPSEAHDEMAPASSAAADAPAMTVFDGAVEEREPTKIDEPEVLDGPVLPRSVQNASFLVPIHVEEAPASSAAAEAPAVATIDGKALEEAGPTKNDDMEVETVGSVGSCSKLSGGSADLAVGAGGFSWGRMFKRTITNAPLLAEVFALAVNLSGVQVPTSVDSVLEALGEPFSILLFVLVGMTLAWSSFKPQLGQVFKILAGRFLIFGPLTVALMYSGLLPTTVMRQACLFVMVCPDSGLGMSYTLDFGHNRSLQAPLMATSNCVFRSAVLVNQARLIVAGSHAVIVRGIFRRFPTKVGAQMGPFLGLALPGRLCRSHCSSSNCPSGLGFIFAGTVVQLHSRVVRCFKECIACACSSAVLWLRLPSVVDVQRVCCLVLCLPFTRRTGPSKSSNGR